MFELVDGEKKVQVAFSTNDSINIDNFNFIEQVYFVRGVYRVFGTPKYVEFTSIYSPTQPNKDFKDFRDGRKIIYGYTCYDTTNYLPVSNPSTEPYEHSITFVRNK